MIAAGWPPVQTASGKAYTFDDSQQSAFMVANSSCLESSGLNEPIGPLPTVEESFRSMANMHACLELAGFEVKSAPTFQSFSDDNGRWTPYEDISFREMDDAEAVCPQNGF